MSINGVKASLIQGSTVSRVTWEVIFHGILCEFQNPALTCLVSVYHDPHWKRERGGCGDREKRDKHLNHIGWREKKTSGSQQEYRPWRGDGAPLQESVWICFQTAQREFLGCSAGQWALQKSTITSLCSRSRGTDDMPMPPQRQHLYPRNATNFTMFLNCKIIL